MFAQVGEHTSRNGHGAQPEKQGLETGRIIPIGADKREAQKHAKQSHKAKAITCHSRYDDSNCPGIFR